MSLSLAARLISISLPYAFTIFVDAAILIQERPERSFSRQSHAVENRTSHQVSSDSQYVNYVNCGNVRRSLMEICIFDVSVVSE